MKNLTHIEISREQKIYFEGNVNIPVGFSKKPSISFTHYTIFRVNDMYLFVLLYKL